jgi:AraC-like DNA-binding protein
VPFDVPEGWRDWLVQQHARQVAPIIDFGRGPADLLALLDLPRAVPGPTMPRGVAAERVARELLRDPVVGHTVEQWAARVSTSPRSLRRAFVDETGTTFARWRTRTRLRAAADLLATSRPVADVAVRCGFASVGGFTKAFRAEFGVGPAEFRSGVWARPSAPAEGARRTSTTWTAPRTNGFHVLVWAFRGSVHARVGGVRHDLAQGDSIWLPAGIVNQTGSPQDAVGLPIGDVPAREVRFDAPLRVRFPPSWETFLLHRSVSAYTGLRPARHDRRDVLDLVADHVAAEQARALPMPADPAARALAYGLLRDLTSWAGTRGPRRGSGGLDAVFRAETGMSWQTWARTARMRAAADMLARGLDPGGVARRVGYAHPSNFSRAFRRFHDEPPRAFRGRVSTPPDETPSPGGLPRVYTSVDG